MSVVRCTDRQDWHYLTLVRNTLQFGLNEGCVRYLNPLEENVCNWMMFVRPAQLWSEINVMLYEVDKKLYFVTTKTLQSKGSELKYGYTSQYADCYGLQVLKKGNVVSFTLLGLSKISISTDIALFID